MVMGKRSHQRRAQQLSYIKRTLHQSVPSLSTLATINKSSLN
ncbi:hypothetical protein NTHI1209_00873 [Haemophilus influenzae]|uniref:Uncharacterized protein n=1 Tax=Haemophilus influenzae TaxID=727 RepID=A0A158SWM5_HAEIF|nr:hypothetical protein NTHI1209_00873 [Haemophilus influenzae]